MTHSKGRPPHKLTVAEYETALVPALDKLADQVQLNCPKGFSDCTVNDEGIWSAKLESLADFVYWQWSPAYYSALKRKEKHLAPSERQNRIDAAAKALQQFLSILNETHDEDREKVLAILANRIHRSQREWYDDYLDELAVDLRGAIEDISDLGTQKIEARRRGPTNPGLAILIQDLHLFHHSFSKSKEPIKAYFEDSEDPNHRDLRTRASTIQTPKNNSSFFCCEIAKIIDPRISESQVRTAMKSLKLPDFLKTARLKNASVCGRVSS